LELVHALLPPYRFISGREFGFGAGASHKSQKDKKAVYPIPLTVYYINPPTVTFVVNMDALQPFSPYPAGSTGAIQGYQYDVPNIEVAMPFRVTQSQSLITLMSL